MKKSRHWLFASILLLACSAQILLAQDPDAQLKQLTPLGRVSDYAGVFQTNELAALETFLTNVEHFTTAEIAVVAMRSLDGGEINDFATRLFEKWGIGKKGKDNGVLLLAAIDDRELKIEVGYGLEGAIPDAKAGRILDEQVIPSFKEGHYARGLTLGAQAIAEIAAQEAGTSLTNNMALPIAASASSPAQFLVFVVILVVFFVIVAILGKKGKKTGSSPGTSSSRPSSGSSSSSSSGRSFGGGRSGGGGASRKW